MPDSSIGFSSASEGERSDFRERGYQNPPPPSDRVSIEKRPAIVARRAQLGDLEADLIIGHQHSGVVLNVTDRKSRRVVLRRLTSKRMNEVREQEEIAMEQFQIRHPPSVVRSRTRTDWCVTTSASARRSLP